MNASRGGDGALERERSGGRRHAIGGVDVVLDQHRNAVKRSAQASGLPLGVECIGDGEGVGVELEDRMERRAIAIERLNPREVLLAIRRAV